MGLKKYKETRCMIITRYTNEVSRAAARAGSVQEVSN